MNRKELDAFAAHYGLTTDALETALDLVAARPGPADIRRMGVRLMHLAGVLSIAAGVVFFVAANWAGLGVRGRFALVEGALIATVGLALWRPPPQGLGRYALLLAFLVTGALFALFGQTYQTGADVYELFVNWSLLGLGFVAAAQWSVAWAAWVLVLNVALTLFCAARPAGGLFWRALSGSDPGLSHLLLIPLLINAGLWMASVALDGSRWTHLAPRWLGRFILACATGYGTWAAMVVLLRAGSPDGGAAGMLVPLLVFAGIAAHTLDRRRDVFPLALIEAGLITLSTTWIVQQFDGDETLLLFVVASWLIVSSTASSFYLMRFVRAWDDPEAPA